MKIVVATNGLGFGGAEAAIVTVANELARRSHDVTVWTLRTVQPMQRIDDLDAEVTIRRLAFDSFTSPASVLGLRRIIEEDRPDAAIYIANPVAAAFHALMDSAPVFYWVQNYIRPRRIRWYELAARSTGTHLVALNDSVGTSVIGGCRTVVPNPMPPSEASSATVHEPAWREGRLLVVGRIVPQKDHEFLLRVVSWLRTNGCAVQLDVVGDGGLLDDVVESARRRGLSDAVHFHGRAASTPWFARQPLVVMTSHWEGQGVVLLEAASHGCPIVARDAPGVRDCLGSGYEGLTPHDSPEAMATTIRAWIEDPHATAERADRLRTRMTAWYSSPKVADAWEQLFARHVHARSGVLRRSAPDGSRRRAALRRLRGNRDPVREAWDRWARGHRNVSFVQIGSYDGTTGDPLARWIDRYPWHGLLVEPNPSAFAMLEQLRGEDPRFRLVQAAVTDHNGTATLYVARPSNRSLWAAQMSSLRATHVAETDECVVPATTYASLVGGVEPDVLHIDAEGYDAAILDQVALPGPTVIMFEHKHLADDDRRRCEARLRDAGYRLIVNQNDCLAIEANLSIRGRSRRHASATYGGGMRTPA